MSDQSSTCEHLAAYALRARWDALPEPARLRLKQHVLDSIGCAFGALNAEVSKIILAEQAEWPATGPNSLIGGGQTIPERAAFRNGALTRYLDFMDTFIAPGEAIHPSDNFAPVLAAAELGDASGEDFLAALAVAYHVQCRLTASGVKIMQAGFDHTIQLSLSVAAGMARALGLPADRTANAIALCGVGNLSLAASRTGKQVPQWKGLAAAATSFQCIHSVRLAQHGITGPLHLFEGPLGFDTVLDKPFGIDWDHEGYDAILGCCLKRYNAEEHSQPCIEALLDLRAQHDIKPDQVRRLHVALFKAGYDMIGGGTYLDPMAVATKEDADHSLPYLMAVALLDGEVSPAQFEPSRIARDDVRTLMQRVTSEEDKAYTADYPHRMGCRVVVELGDGRRLEKEASDYLGFSGRPMPWEGTVAKFRQLSADTVPPAQQSSLMEMVAQLERVPARQFARALRLEPA